jgi:cystathionine beta-lyase
MKKRPGWKIKKEWLAYAPGVVPAVHLSIMAFSHPGDSVLVNSPVYYPFYSAIKNTGRQLLVSPLKSDEGRYEMDFDDIERRIDSRTRLFILSNPHNPVGRVWKIKELEDWERSALSTI